MPEKIITEFSLAISVYCTCYMLVFLAITGDLWAGVRKAKKAGQLRRSCEFRRTVEKVAKYYNCLFSVSIIDCFIMMAICSMKTKGFFTGIPLFPVITIIIGCYLAFIEVRSVFEKFEDKEKSHMTNDLHKMLDLMKDDKRLNKIIELLKQIK